MKNKLTNGWYVYDPNFFTRIEADEYFDYFLNNLGWQGGEIKLFGKTYAIPRKQIYFADEGMNYSYSGKSLNIAPWDKEIDGIRNKIMSQFDHPINACLANLYRDGIDSNGWHADDEKELGKNPVICSVSLGAMRKFQLKHKNNGERIQLFLEHGSLLIMGGEMQHFWKHQVPKEPKIDIPRINLTFRRIINV